MSGGAPGVPPLVGLTGGIGAGKSAALAALARHGAATLSADEVIHRLYDDPEVVAAVVGRFGDSVLAADGRVDRAVLGPRAFAEPGGVRFLEELLHPRVGAERARWVAARRADVPPPPLIVCEVPLLFEVGSESDYDVVVVVTAPDALRRERVAARGQDFDARAARQLPEAEKAARADVVYENTGGLDDLDAWAAGLVARVGVEAPG